MSVSIGKFRGRTRFFIAAGLLVLAAILFGVIAAGPRYTPVSANSSISIETNDLRQGDVRFFTYRDRAGDQIRFLLARDATGRTKAAFDACQRCYMYHKGYAGSRGDLFCRFCGNRYKLEAMESGLASCVPVKLPFQMKGRTVNIKPADLERARALF
jgi:uncharacterized membrane protein